MGHLFNVAERELIAVSFLSRQLFNRSLILAENNKKTFVSLAQVTDFYFIAKELQKTNGKRSRLFPDLNTDKCAPSIH